jgi:ATP-dependent DNA ligase
MHKQVRILNPYRTYPDDPYAFGELPHIACKKTGATRLRAGRIYLQYGHHYDSGGFGWKHIKIKHETKIADMCRGISVFEYINAVTIGYQCIVHQSNGSFVLMKYNGATKFLALNPKETDGVQFYNIGTGFPRDRMYDLIKRGDEVIWGEM